MTHIQDKDFSPNGLKLEGSYENDRNAQSREVFKAIIREAYGVTDVIVAHHLTYVAEEKRVDTDGRAYSFEVVEEIPSADTLIFDHDVARKIWGPNFKEILVQLVCEPCESRDDLLAKLWNQRNAAKAA
jgi:hypothetical protein